MSEKNKTELGDDISEMIETSSGHSSPSPEALQEALRSLSSSEDEELSKNPWIRRYHELPAYPLDVVRDGSEMYVKALTDAILAITRGEYGSIDYKGYQIYYNDTPHVKSVSITDDHKEYSYEVGFRCDALMAVFYEEYHSEDERNAFLDPENDLFRKTLALLDKEIETLDEGTWIKRKKTLDIWEFKDYSPDGIKFKDPEWNDRNIDASETFSYLMEDAIMRTKEKKFSETDFNTFARVVRRMVFFADYGKINDRCSLDGFVRFEWKPNTKIDKYIWRCMNEFGQIDLPDNLLDNCTLYYFLDDPQGWDALAYLLPILALWEMCQDYDPDTVKNVMLKVFDLIPDDGNIERIEKLIEEDRAKANSNKGGHDDDQEDI